MFGANYYAEGYFAQGSFVETPLFLKTVKGSTTTVAFITHRLSFTKTLHATTTTVAHLTRMVMRTVSAASFPLAAIANFIVPQLNVKNTSTRALDYAATTLSLDDPKYTESLDEARVTMRITDRN